MLTFICTLKELWAAVIIKPQATPRFVYTVRRGRLLDLSKGQNFSKQPLRGLKMEHAKSIMITTYSAKTEEATSAQYKTQRSNTNE